MSYYLFLGLLCGPLPSDFAVIHNKLIIYSLLFDRKLGLLRNVYHVMSAHLTFQ